MFLEAAATAKFDLASVNFPPKYLSLAGVQYIFGEILCVNGNNFGTLEYGNFKHKVNMKP